MEDEVVFYKINTFINKILVIKKGVLDERQKFENGDITFKQYNDYCKSAGDKLEKMGLSREI